MEYMFNRPCGAGGQWGDRSFTVVQSSARKPSTLSVGRSTLKSDDDKSLRSSAQLAVLPATIDASVSVFDRHFNWFGLFSTQFDQTTLILTEKY